MSRIICRLCGPSHFTLILFCNTAVHKYNVENEFKVWICHCIVTKQVRNKLSWTIVTWLGWSGRVELIVLILSTYFSAAISVLDYSIISGQRKIWQKSWQSIREDTNGKRIPWCSCQLQSQWQQQQHQWGPKHVSSRIANWKLFKSHGESLSTILLDMSCVGCFLCLTVQMYSLLDPGIFC